MIQKSAESGFCGVLGGGEKTQVRLKQNARTLFFKHPCVFCMSALLLWKPAKFNEYLREKET